VAVGALVAAANEAGGEDNITVIVARLRAPGPGAITPSDGIEFLPPV
jgi:serine/threonine protein phosphatase PrpC